MRMVAFIIFLIASLLCSSSVHSQKDKPANQFEIDILEAHNKYRSAHGVPPLKWSSKLQKFAQDWANHLTTLTELKHSNRSGENLYRSPDAKNYKNRDAVDSWYNEIKSYDFKKNEMGSAGHFTQVVWKDTKFMGAGKAIRGNTICVAANYDPPGNYAEEFTKNVPPRK